MNRSATSPRPSPPINWRRTGHGVCVFLKNVFNPLEIKQARAIDEVVQVAHAHSRLIEAVHGRVVLPAWFYIQFASRALDRKSAHAFACGMMKFFKKDLTLFLH
jgi:hypothetical protein